MNSVLFSNSLTFRKVCIILFWVIFVISYSVVAQTGKVTIITQPPGAFIWLDDQEIGSTPIYNRDIKTGFHSLRLVDPVTNAATTQSVQVIADSLVTINVALGTSTGYLSVESTPKGADVALVTSLGKTPLHNIPINAGDYAVRIIHPKQLYKDVVENITVDENEPENIIVTLPKNKRYIGKTTAKILLGVTAIGLYAWGFSARADGNKVSGTVGFSLGTLCIIGVEVFSFY